MISVSAALVVVLFVYKAEQFPRIGYEHLLVDYHFGFTKRALIGEILSLAFPKIAIWAVFVLGAMIWLATLLLFLVAFDRYFGLNDRQLPLFVFMACSPMSLKNFVQTVGYFDIYGCAFGLILLLLPVRSFGYVIVAGAGSLALLLIHHVHALLYLPTITVIVVARYYLAKPHGAMQIGGGAAIVALTVVFFATAQFVGAPSVSQPVFLSYMVSRMAGPTLPLIDADIWYHSLHGEVIATWSIMTKNLLRLPIYVAVIAVHYPLFAYFRRLVSALTDVRHRRASWAAAALITAGYLIICMVIFDYSRWVANWFTCMVLLTFAIKSLPTTGAVETIPDSLSSRRLGWIVAALPRLGTTLPF